MKKTEILYHGSPIGGIKIFKLQKRYAPEILGDDAVPALYAGDLPAYAIGHGFPWSSHEGFDIDVKKNGDVVLIVPRKYEKRINKKIFLYTVPRASFHLLKNVTPVGHNFASYETVKPISCVAYRSVREGFEKNGGRIKFIDSK